MRLDEFLVKELRDEHRDREWVDRHGTHWAWMDDRWHYEYREPRYSSGYSSTWYSDPPASPERGPFMEAMHHRATR